MLIESRDLLELIEKNAYDVVQRNGRHEKGMTVTGIRQAVEELCQRKETNKSVCRGCGAEIKWIKMKSGKMMPVDPEPIPYKTELHSPKKRTLVTEDGRVVSGFLDLESDKIGYVSHFATCPSAGRFRGAKE